jgi:hypothetical protein
MSAGIAGICGRLAAAGLGAALVVIGGTAPAAAAGSMSASCVGQIVSTAAPVIVPFGRDVVTVQVAASGHQFGQTVASVTAAQPRDACQQPQP